MKQLSPEGSLVIPGTGMLLLDAGINGDGVQPLKGVKIVFQLLLYKAGPVLNSISAKLPPLTNTSASCVPNLSASAS